MICAERGCPYPAGANGLCARHSQMYHVTPKSTCAHGAFYRFGRDRNGNQRYMCKMCCKTFTRTPDNRQELVRAYRSGLSCQSTGRRLGMDRSTVSKRFRKLRFVYGASRCACGRPASHAGRCVARRNREALEMLRAMVG